MRRADRLFQLILLLRGRKKTTARWLADALEVSERTIYRDIQDLMCSGVPIEGEAGFGYVLLKNFELPPLMFSKEELQALRLGVGMVAVWSSEKLEEAAENALRKINAAVPPAIQDSPQVLVVPKLHHPPILGLDEIYQAIRHQNQMQINYVRRDGQTSDRLVCPLGPPLIIGNFVTDWWKTPLSPTEVLIKYGPVWQSLFGDKNSISGTQAISDDKRVVFLSAADNLSGSKIDRIILERKLLNADGTYEYVPPSDVVYILKNPLQRQVLREFYYEPENPFESIELYYNQVSSKGYSPFVYTQGVVGVEQ